MRRFSYSPLWLARSLVGLARHPEWPSSRGRDRPGLLLETPCRIPLRALMSGMLTTLSCQNSLFHRHGSSVAVLVIPKVVSFSFLMFFYNYLFVLTVDVGSPGMACLALFIAMHDQGQKTAFWLMGGGCPGPVVL